MAEPPKILQVTYGAFSCTLEGFEEPVEALLAVADHIRGLGMEDPLWAGGLRLPSAEELARLIAEAQMAGGDEVRIDLGAPPAVDLAGQAEAGLAGSADSLATDGGRGGELAVTPEDETEPGGEARPGGGAPEPREANDAAAGLAAAKDDSSEDADVQPVIGVRMDGSFDSGALRTDPGSEVPAEARAESAAESGGTPEVPPAAGRSGSVAPEGLEEGRGGSVPEGGNEAARPAPAWFGDEEEDPEPRPPSRFRDADEARVGVDLEQLALALAVRRSPPPPAEVAPAPQPASEAPSAGEDPAPDLPEPLPPDAEPAPPYDWGRGEEDDWFVSGAAIEPGPITVAPDPSSPGRRWLLGQSPDQDETVLLRILTRAEAKLADPEAQRRRETIAHLKAAVAATEAERAGGEPPTPEPMAEDAAPTGASGEAAAMEERPGSPPLRLVASQRVDLPRMRAALRAGRARPLARAAEDEMESAWAPAGLPGAGVPAAAFVAGAPEEGVLAKAPPAPMRLDQGSPAEPVRPAAEAVASVSGPGAESAIPGPEASLDAVPERTVAEPSRPEPAAEAVAMPAAEPVLEAVQDPVAPSPAEPPEPLEPPARGPSAPSPQRAAEGFAAFAAAHGATALADLLEAATAWASRRSGLGEAARAEVAALVAEALPEEPPREEVLRVLGILLREGRLLKVGGGRLRAAPGSRFEAEG